MGARRHTAIGPGRVRAGTAGFALFAAVLFAGAPLAEPVACPGGVISVDGADAGLTRTICQIAVEVGHALGQCGLNQTRPLTIEVVEDLSHPMGKCLAYFDCDYDLIRVTDPALYESLLDEEVTYALLPPETAMRALLTHEMTHAFITQTAGDRTVDLVDHEYIAAAMELELMEPEWREVTITAAPVSLPPKTGLIDIWIYYFEPRKFAVNAWQHFSLPENGCDLIRRIVAGETTMKLQSL